ncbi:hypothetical protein [Phenylobacterium sp.]|uniref:hypothetical protein n=1 Tax=Phenylobacterium sp. TaxID=1871053 RepID=UPI002FC78927
MRQSLDIPPGLSGDDTTFVAAGRWADASNVRFHRGRPQVVGGWESLTADLLTGVCRTVFNWTDRTPALNIAFGTHSKLQVWVGGGLYDITPTLAMPSVLLGADPLAVVNTTPTVTVTHLGHGLTTGATVVMSGAAAVGGITPNGSYVITVTGVNAYTVTHGSNATSTVSGGGSAVRIAPQVAFAAGSIDGAGGAGYGVGAYSTGEYSEPSTADYFPRTWALAAWGANLLANPRGGTIHAWTNATGTPAAPLANAPANVSHMLVAPQDMVFALGCNEEVSGVFNPLCIRHSGVRANTVWNTSNSTTAREYILPGGGRIVGGRAAGRYVLVWTNHALFLGDFVGSLQQPWRFERVGDKCGLIGPNAVVVVGQRAFWIGPDLQFYTYAIGGAVEPLECPIREAFADNLTPAQADKIMAASISAFTEVRWDYPDGRDGTENSRYLLLNIKDGSWSRGIMARTAFVDAGPSDFPIGVTAGGAIFWHERGQSADGSAFSWFIKTADQYLSEDRLMMVRGVWPDLADQVGPVWITVESRLKPQGDVTTKGPYSMAVGDDKTDLRANGRLFNVTLAGNSAPTYTRLGRLAFDVAPTSMR